MSDIAIQVDKLGKMYRIGAGQERHDTLRDAVMGLVRRKPPEERDGPEFWALRDVSFEVKRGEVIGVIGRNGAGKSTLLKILSRITEPSEGRAILNGRVGSLLEVGTGFHPELTGRENVYLSGAILGMRQSEIERQFDEIVAFAEIEKFLDTPVKRYSSGMYVRLAFAVAAHLNPEILLVDEVLAVGDAQFQKKCLGKMGEVAHEGRTVLFVSHNMLAIQNLCERAVLVEKGRLALWSDASTAVGSYLAANRSLETNVFAPSTATSVGDLRMRIADFQLITEPIRTGGRFAAEIHVERRSTGLPLLGEISIGFHAPTGAKSLQMYSAHVDAELLFEPGTTRVVARAESLPLAPGDYQVSLWLGTGKTPVHWLEDCMTMRVEPGALAGDRVVDARGYPVVAVSSWAIAPRENS